jgi:crotonobetaine/carnitine-CoA ligase
MHDHDSLLALLRTAALEAPERECLRIGDRSYSRRRTADEVESVARGLRALGIEPGDRVGLMCDNRPETLFSWLGVNAMRAIDVPFNAEARGRLLAYLVHDAAPRVLIGTEEYLQILADTITSDPEFVVLIGGGSAAPFAGRARQVSFADLVDLGAAYTEELPEPRPGDIATIMYTSGTTGPSKGVMLPQRYYPANGDHAARLMGVRDDDVVLCVQPLFHIDSRAFLATAWSAGGTIVVGTRFSVSGFWDQVRAEGATIFSTIGTMLWMLFKEVARPDDAELPARLAICSSTPGEILQEFEARFGVAIVEAYGMTECVLLTSAPAGETVPGRVGRAISEVDVRLVRVTLRPVRDPLADTARTTQPRNPPVQVPRNPRLPPRKCRW